MYVTVPSDFDLENAQSCIAHATTALPQTSLKAGAHLFREGDEVERLHQVTSGVLRLTRLLEDGRRQVIAFGYPGDIVGFPSNGRHHTDCDALTDVHLQPYRRAALEDGQGDPLLHKNLLQAALREIGAMQDHFMMLGRKSASEKLASFLLVLSSRCGESVGPYTEIELPMSRSDIADFLGLTTETVSRTFTHFRKNEIIALERSHTVIVLSPEALRAVAQPED